MLNRLMITLFQRIKYQLSDLEQLNEISEKNLFDLSQKAEELDKRREQAGYIFSTISNYIGKEAYVKKII